MPPTIRINNGALRLGSGTLSTSLPPPPVIPQEANILHHWDFTDITTLFRDEAGTIPIDSDGQACRLALNIGSDTGNDVHGDFDVRSPNWNASATILECAQAVPGNGKTLFSGNMGASVLGPWSIAILGYEITAWQSLSQIVFYIDGHSGPTKNWAVKNNQDGVGSTTWSINMGQPSASAISFSVMPQALNTNYSMIGWGNDTPEQKAWSSTEAAPITDTAGTPGQLIGQNRPLGIFAGSSTGSNGIRGRFREVIFWAGYQLTDADVEQIKAYDTLNYGTVWA